MFFDPSGPITLALTIGAILASGYSFYKGSYHCALALLISVVSARLLTISGELSLHNFFMLLCGLICIINIKSPWLLDVKENAVNYTVSVLYMIRILVVELFPSITGLIVANDISLFLLFIQIILVSGDAKGGRKFNTRVYYFGSSAYDRVVSFCRAKT